MKHISLILMIVLGIFLSISPIAQAQTAQAKGSGFHAPAYVGTLQSYDANAGGTITSYPNNFMLGVEGGQAFILQATGGDLNFVHGGTNAVVIDGANQRLGIGIDTPLYSLHTNGAPGTIAIYTQGAINSQGAITAGAGVGSTVSTISNGLNVATQDLQVVTGNLDVVAGTADFNKQVTIDTEGLDITTGNLDVIAGTGHVQGVLTVDSDIVTLDAVQVSETASDTPGMIQYKGGQFLARDASGWKPLVTSTTGGNSLLWSQTNGNADIFNANTGNVGIGGAPAVAGGYKLDVTGNARANNLVATTDVSGNTATITTVTTTNSLDTFAHANIGTDANVGGNVNAQGNANINQTVNANIDVNAANDVNAGRNVGASSNVIAGGYVSAGTNVNATQNVEAGNNLRVQNNANIISGNIDVQTGTLHVDGKTGLGAAAGGATGDVLTVGGGITLGTSGHTNDGTIRWTGSQLQVYDSSGAAWRPLVTTTGTATSTEIWIREGDSDIYYTSGNVGVGDTPNNGGTSYKFDVHGTSYFDNAVTIDGITTLNNNLNVVGAHPVDFDGTLNVDGATTLGGTLGVTGHTSLSTLGTSGLATLNSLDVTNNADVGGTLGVTGHTSLSTLGTSGLATLDSLTVTGTSTLADVSATDLDVTSTDIVAKGVEFGAANSDTEGTVQWISGSKQLQVYDGTNWKPIVVTSNGASNPLIWQQNAAGEIYTDASDIVGIGTNNPDNNANLHVVGKAVIETAAGRKLTFEDNGGGQGITATDDLYVVSPKNIHFGTNSGSGINLRVDGNTGYVGIGTGTTPATDQLDVNGDTDIEGSLYVGTAATDALDVTGTLDVSGNTNLVGNGFQFTSPWAAQILTVTDDLYVVSPKNIHFGTNSGAGINLRVDGNTGYVGIGTGTTPATDQLDVNGDADISGDLDVHGTFTVHI